MLRVCIDPGHGGKDRGIKGARRHEAADALKLGLLLRKKLLAQNVDVLITRAFEENIDINTRCMMANRTHCCFLLSLHRASLDEAPHNVTCWISSSPDERSRRVGAALTEAVSNATGFTSRGVRTGTPSKRGYKDFSANVLSDMPSAHIEIGSVLSYEDNKIFDERLDSCAEAMTKAMCKTMGVKYNPRAAVNPSAE